MDLNTIASDLRAQATPGSKIKLNESVFPDATVRADIRSAFALSDPDLVISVKAEDIHDPTDGVLTISTAKASVLKQTDVSVKLIFTAPGGALQAVIIVEMPSSWKKFTDSFDGLDRFPFNSLETSGAHFVYTTVEQLQFAWPGEQQSTSIDLKRGLNFLSHVTFNPTLQTLLKFVVGDRSLSLKWWGRFAPAKGEELPVGKLRAQLASGSFDVGVDRIQLSLSEPAIAVQIGETSDDSPVQPIDLLVEAKFQQSLKIAIAIPATGGALEISSTPLPNFDAIDALIGSLPGGQVFTDFTTHLPPELKDVFKDLALDNFALRVPLKPKPAVSYFGLSVTTANPWIIIRDVLVLKEVRLEIQTIEPTDINWTRVQIRARAEFLPKLNIFPGKFDFVVELEKQTSWKLATISGSYYGSVNLGTIAGKLIGESAVPLALRGIEFSDFGVNVNREGEGFNCSFHGSAAASFPILDHEFTSALTLVVNRMQSGSGVEYDVDLAGGLVIGEQVFSLSLKLGKSDSKLTATWENQGTPLGFGDIASAFGWDSMPELPEGLDLALARATFDYDFQKKSLVLTAHSMNYGQIVFASVETASDKKRVYLFSLDIPLDLKFSNAPLIGESLRLDPPVGIDELQIDVASDNLTKDDVTELNTYLERPLIPELLAKGVTIAANIEMSGPHQIVLPLTGGAKDEEQRLLLSGAATDESTSTLLAAPGYQAEPKWFTLKKTLGPVHFDKVGVQYQSATLRFLLNAAFSAAGLTLSVDGLSVGSSLKKFEPEFDLRGLGIEYKAGDLEIGGAFLRTLKPAQDGKPAQDSYDGTAVIKTKQFAVSALGSYTKLDDGQPSLFIYAFLDYPLGGPAFFFITGLAAGFGYNRRLIAPSIEKVAEFPLIVQAVRGREAAPKNLTEALTKLQTHVPPASGSIFLAVGVKFNSFKLVDSFALLTIEFGNDNFAVNLLGISKAVVPTPEAGKTVTPLAQIEIAWKATYNPDDGCLGIDARLTPNSYILSKECRLTGGYAFYSWFSGPHAGDFVQTLGGYHPEFQVPSHYPRVPRLAFDWRVSSSLTIQGDAYYALTGSALMAGGHLEVLYRQGELRAWLKVGADFLIAWKPYHYDARLYVNVGASYTFDINLLFTSVRVTISVDVGAQLHLWGPDFSGTASIDLSVISFTIAFGAGASQIPPAIKEWSNFRQSFLPAPKDVCTISVKDGLVRNIEAKGKDPERWVINPKQFSLVIDSAIPIKTAPLLGGDLNGRANIQFGIAPMAKSKDEFKNSTLEVTITKQRSGAIAAGNDSPFRYTLIKKLVPAGLWGETAAPNVNDKKFLEDVATGIEITGKAPDAGTTTKINLDAFEFAPEPCPNAFNWEETSSFAVDEKDSKARRNKIADTVGSNEKRDALRKELGLTFEINIKPEIARDFVTAPQIGTFVWPPK